MHKSTITALKAEIDTLNAQLQRNVLEQEQNIINLRVQLNDSTERLDVLTKDHSAKLLEYKALKKTSEKNLQDTITANREEKLATEREYTKKIKELESSLIAQESKANDHKRALESCEEKLQRKKRKTEDGKSSIQLARVEIELNYIRQQKTELENQLNQTKEQNVALEHKNRVLERELESKITAIKIEYETQLCSMQTKQFS